MNNLEENTVRFGRRCVIIILIVPLEDYYCLYKFIKSYFMDKNNVCILYNIQKKSDYLNYCKKEIFGFYAKKRLKIAFYQKIG